MHVAMLAYKPCCHWFAVTTLIIVVNMIIIIVWWVRPQKFSYWVLLSNKRKLLFNYTLDIVLV